MSSNLINKTFPLIIVPFGPPGIGKGTFAKNCVNYFDWKHVSTGNLCRLKLAQKDDVSRELFAVIREGKLVEDALMFKIVTPFLDLVVQNSKNSLCDYSISGENMKNNAINSSLDVLDRVSSFFKKYKTCLLDGFPRNDAQIKFLKNFLEEHDISQQSCLFVFLHASDQVILDRLAHRVVCSNKSCEISYNERTVCDNTCSSCKSKLIKREDDAYEVIQNRLNLYKKSSDLLKTMLVENGFPICSVNAENDELVVLNNFCNVFLAHCGL